MSIVKENSFLRVAALEINEDGKVSRKNMTVDRDSQLENTLLKADYPAIRVATIDIPQQQLDQYQQAMVEHSLGKQDHMRRRGVLASWALRHPRRMASTTQWTPRTPRSSRNASDSGRKPR